MQIIKKLSPNFGKGRQGYKPELIVIHIMSGSLSGTDSWFATTKSQVSSHYGVGNKGEIHQYVEEENTAWANGRVDRPTAKLLKRDINPNLYTLSIEHEGQDLSKAPESLLKASAELIRYLCTKYSIPLDREHIIGHYEIFAQKPQCPASDKTVINKLIEIAKDTPHPEEVVEVPVPKSKLQKVLAFLKTI